jgi:hypothetical protein
MFFRSVIAREQTAIELRAKGVKDTSFTQEHQRKSGLSSTEMSLVKEVAGSCMDAFEAKARSQEATNLAVAENRRIATKASRSDAEKQKLEAMQKQLQDIMDGCAQQLRNGLGEPRYNQLRQYLRNDFATAINLDAPKLESGPDTSKGGKQ